MEISKKVNWKSVSIEDPACNDLEGLVGIEELIDYDIDSFKNNRKENYKTNAASKKKSKSTLEKSDDTDLHVIKSKYLASDYNNDNENLKINYVVSPKRLKILKYNGKIKTKKKLAVKESKTKIEVGTIVQNKNKCNIEDLEQWINFGLSDKILQALADCGFKRPTLIQSLTLPAAIFGRRDILGAAETGSGKTLAFGLPIINGILDHKKKTNETGINKDMDDTNVCMDIDYSDKESDSGGSEKNDETDLSEFNIKIKELKSFNNLKPLYALILTPTRELAVQIKNHLIAIAQYTGIKVAVVVGGMAAVKQERILSKCPEIVVATPGRLWELIQDGNPHLSQVDNIQYLAIDETDRMLERGHYQELHQLLERINTDEEIRKSRQNFVFSATLTLVHDIPKYLLKKKWHGSKVLKLTPGQKLQKVIKMLGINNPKVVDITKESGTAHALTECRITCPIEEKDFYLYYFLKRHPGRTLIFCNSIGCVKRLTTLFTLLECNPLPLHATMQQRQRLKNLERFRDDLEGVLIATDVAARGLDIPKVQHVIHYQCPRTAENYIHRSGRTARADEEGITVLFMEPTELKSYIRLCKTLGRSEDLPIFPVDDKLLSAVKQRVNLARDLDKLELQMKRANAETGWFQKAIDEMDIIVDDNDAPQIKLDDLSAVKHAVNIKRKQLLALISKPLFPKGFSMKYPSSNLGMDGFIVPKLQANENAVETMKKALENYARSGKKIGSLAPKFKNNNIASKRKKKVKKSRKK